MDFEDFDDDVLNELIDLSTAAEDNLNRQTPTPPQKSEPGPDHLKILTKYFGHANFRPLQWEIISAIINNHRDVCAVMATGYGKSLCFQFPSVFQGGITLVISPLISLMEDQVLSLQVSNIPACLLGSAQKKQAQVMKEILQNMYSLVYLTPEFCTGDLGIDFLKKISNQLSVNLIAIDEAHCISSWGHDFRFQYRNLGSLRTIFNQVPIIAVTATATPQVRHDIINSLQLRNPLSVCSGFDRPNLYFEVNLKGTQGVFKDLTKTMTCSDSHWKFSGSTIIYCITRKQTEEISLILSNFGIKCRAYHAGLPLNIRQQTHEEFVKDKIDVVVATIAFGMGIDKPDVRNIIHYGSSKSVESYYQEVGRAGRDGLPANCVTFYSDSDFVTLRNLEDNPFWTQSQKENNFKKIEAYLNTRQCRRRYILDYFQDEHADLKESRPNCCDNCTKKLSDGRSDQQIYEGVDEKGCYDFTNDARIMLNAVSSLKYRTGLATYVLFLRGSKSSKLYESYQRHALHGSGKHRSEEWWKAIAKILVHAEYLQENFQKTQKFSYRTISITDKGTSFLRDDGAKLLLPPPSNMLKLLKTKKVEQSSWLRPNSKVLQPSTSRSAEESEVAIAERMALYHELLDRRAEIAAELDCMPYMVASNAAIMEMSRAKPGSIDELKRLNLDGMTEAKLMKFGNKFLSVVNNTSATSAKKRTIRDILETHPLPDVSIGLAAEISCSLLQSGLTVGEIGAKRGVPASTIISHLTTGIKMGYPIKLIELGVTEELRDVITDAFRQMNIGFADVKLKDMKERCPPEVTYDNVKAVLAYLQVRQHLDSLGMPYEEFEDFRFEKEDKADQNLNTLIQLCDEIEEPPCKKEKTEYSAILDSPPRQFSTGEEPSGANETSDCAKAVSQTSNDAQEVRKSKTKALPPWLITKKLRK